MAGGLIAAGIEVGDRVALLSRTRYEWTLFDYAILAAGAVTVPIYETSSDEQIEWILSDSGATAVVVESAKHAPAVDRARRRVGAPLRRIWQIEPPAGAPSTPGAVEQLVALGADVPADEVHARRRAVGADDLATLIYTSGTTGRPKGCELTHRNVLSEVKSVTLILPELLNPTGSVLLFLPLAHVFGKVIQCGALATRTVVGHTPDVAHLADDLGTFRPTFLLAVPRVFEKVYNSARQRAQDAGKGRIFDAAADTAIAWSQARASGRPGPLLAARHALFDRLVYRQAAGGGRRPGAGRGVRQRSARGAARALLPRGGAARAGGLRADRDLGRDHREHAVQRSASAASGARCPGTACGSPTTGRCCCPGRSCSAGTGTTTRPPRRRSPTAGSTAATSASSTTPATCGSPGGRRSSS